MPPFYNYFISFKNLEVSYSSTSLTVIKNERLRSIFFTFIRNPQLQDALSGGEAKIPKSKSSLICNQGLELACSCTNSTASNLEQYSNIQGKLEKSCTHLALLTYIKWVLLKNPSVQKMKIHTHKKKKPHNYYVSHQQFKRILYKTLEAAFTKKIMS